VGRGRAKAKQTKVARELKYFSPQTDLDRLRAELAGGTSDAGKPEPSALEESDDDVDDLEDPDDESWSARG